MLENQTNRSRSLLRPTGFGGAGYDKVYEIVSFDKVNDKVHEFVGEKPYLSAIHVRPHPTPSTPSYPTGYRFPTILRDHLGSAASDIACVVRRPWGPAMLVYETPIDGTLRGRRTGYVLETP